MSTAGDKERVCEGSMAPGCNFELWQYYTNSTTAVALATKFSKILSVQATYGVDMGGTTAIVLEATVSGGTVSMTCSNTLSNYLVYVMVCGYT